MANSSMLVFANDTMPASLCIFDHRRVVGRHELASIFEPQVVSQPSAQRCPSGRQEDTGQRAGRTWQRCGHRHRAMARSFSHRR